MNMKEYFQHRFPEFCVSMEDSPNYDRVIYRCTHAALIFVAVLFVLAGFLMAVFAAVVLSLAVTGHDAWQVRLSRYSSLVGLIAMGLYIVGSLAAIPFVGLTGGPFADLSSFFALLVVIGSLTLWFIAADRFYSAAYRLPPEENTGPW